VCVIGLFEGDRDILSHIPSTHTTENCIHSYIPSSIQKKEKIDTIITYLFDKNRSVRWHVRNNWTMSSWLNA